MTLEPDYDPSLWLEVPLAFPSGSWATAEEWADEVGESSPAGIDDAEARRAQLRAGALEVARFGRGGEARRFWYFPLSGQALSLAHLYLLPPGVVSDETVADFLSWQDGRITDPVVETFDVAGVRVVRSLLLAEAQPAGAPDGPARQAFGVARAAVVGEAGATVIEIVDADLREVSTVRDDLVVLAGSIAANERNAADV